MATHSGDSIIDACLAGITAAEYGADARPYMARAVDRCRQLAGGGSSSYASTIHTAVYGDDVRAAFESGIRNCYSARGISPSGSADSALTRFRTCQTGEEMKSCMLTAIQLCCQEIRR